MAGRSTEIRHLQGLVTLAQELHFGRAAQRLNMTQPALSQLIRDLETKLGFRLLERTTRKVLLTSPGRSFLAEAETILRYLERAIETAQAEAGQAANTLRIGAILPTAFDFLPRVLSRFRHRFPDAQVHIENKDSPQLVNAVETGALHVAILRPPSKAGTLRIETLRREPFVAAMRADHRLAKIETLATFAIYNRKRSSASFAVISGTCSRKSTDSCKRQGLISRAVSPPTRPLLPSGWYVPETACRWCLPGQPACLGERYAFAEWMTSAPASIS